MPQRIEIISNTISLQHLKKLSKRLSILVMLAGLLLLSGFIANVPTLKRLFGSNAVAVSVASLCLTVIVLNILTREKPRRPESTTAFASPSVTSRPGKFDIRAVVGACPVSVLFIDNSYVVVDYNPLMAEFASMAWPKPLQRNVSLLHIIPAEKIESFKTYFENILKGEEITFEVSYPWNDGTESTFNMNLRPVGDSDGKIIGGCLSSEMITLRNTEGLKISELNVLLEKKVADRTAQYEAVNKELEAFTFSVSHDLRSPLRAVNSYAQIMVEEYGNILDENGRSILESIRYNGEKMGNLIDELLAFSMLGRKEIQRENVNMAELVNTVIADLTQVFRLQANIRIGILPLITANNTMLYQVLYNLIGNALKYSAKKEKPVIEVFATEADGKTVFTVKDNGAGFDMRFADKLFGVFQRLHSEKQFEGNGVGLAIVQRIVNKFGGKVWAEAKVNEGATFHFTLN